jgi:hypothetical protein
MYVREHIENLLAALIGERLQAEIFDQNPQWLGYSLDITENVADEFMRFEVLVDDGDTDALIIADGVIDHNFDLILTYL